MKPRQEQILKTHSELNTYGKPMDIIFQDGETYYFTPKPIPSKKKPQEEESEQSKQIRKEIYGQFRAYGSSMPIRWREME
jgi:hypothetical protein